MTDLSGAPSQEDRIMVITKMALNVTKWLPRVRRPLKVIAFNANGIWKR
jgi:hypothetical protein